MHDWNTIADYIYEYFDKQGQPRTYKSHDKKITTYRSLAMCKSVFKPDKKNYNMVYI